MSAFGGLFNGAKQIVSSKSLQFYISAGNIDASDVSNVVWCWVNVEQPTQRGARTLLMGKLLPPPCSPPSQSSPLHYLTIVPSTKSTSHITKANKRQLCLEILAKVAANMNTQSKIYEMFYRKIFIKKQANRKNLQIKMMKIMKKTFYKNKDNRQNLQKPCKKQLITKHCTKSSKNI